jgi:valyl-tRNA synthetase
LQESKLESARNFANKIWNATRFVLLNCGDILEDQEPVEWETTLSESSLADRWILSRLNAATAEVNLALEEFRFHEAAATLYQFFWNDFCDWYIELSKPFVTSTEITDENTAVKRRIIYILERSLSLLHPLMPFITEELWQRLPHHGKTICLNEFPETNARDEQAEREMELFTGLVSKLRNIRSTFNIAPSVAINAKVAATEAASQAVIEAMSAQIKRLARLENLEIVEAIETQKGSVRDVVSDIEIAVPLSGLVDFEKEKARLEGNVTKLSKELDGLQKRLSNADFVARAAVEVVAESRARAAELEEQIAKLNAMITAM